MKQVCKYIVIPQHLFSHGDLTIMEKWTLVAIDSFCLDGAGVVMGVQAISSASGLPVKTVKTVMKSLYDKGAFDITVSEDNQKIIRPLLYKERYIAQGDKVIIGDKPTDAITLPWEDISEKWAEYCPTLPKITRWSAARKNRVRSCLKAANASVEDLYKVFRLVASSAFLNGSKESWSCSFDWLIKSSTNFIKVWEGNYHNRDYNERKAYEDIMAGRYAENKEDTQDYYR